MNTSDKIKLRFIIFEFADLLFSILFLLRCHQILYPPYSRCGEAAPFKTIMLQLEPGWSFSQNSVLFILATHNASGCKKWLGPIIKSARLCWLDARSHQRCWIPDARCLSSTANFSDLKWTSTSLTYYPSLFQCNFVVLFCSKCQDFNWPFFNSYFRSDQVILKIQCTITQFCIMTGYPPLHRL